MIHPNFGRVVLEENFFLKSVQERHQVMEYSIQHYVIIKFVSDLQQVSGFLQVLRFPPPIKLIATI
jgi:hypothetical protein